MFGINRISLQFWPVGLGALLLVGACSSDDASDDPGNKSNADNSSKDPSTTEKDDGTAGSGAAAAPSDSAMANQGAGGTTGQLPACPEDESPASCGDNTCDAIDPNLAMICVQGCCTAAGTCGTFNAAAGSDCTDPTGGSDHMCPTATVAGTEVPGCCVEGGDTCGIVDLTGFLSSLVGGDSNNCIPRSAVPATVATLEPLNCDGTSVETEDTTGEDTTGEDTTGEDTTGEDTTPATDGGAATPASDAGAADDAADAAAN